MTDTFNYDAAAGKKDEQQDAPVFTPDISTPDPKTVATSFDSEAAPVFTPDISTPDPNPVATSFDFEAARRTNPVEDEKPFREITDPRGGPRVNQPPPRQWSVFGTPLPGTQAAAQGEEIHPLSRAVLENFDLTADISGNSAALRKIVSGVYGPNYDANRAAPIPVDDLTDDQLAKIIEQPRMQRALQLASITRRRLAEDAEEAAILRGEIPIMLAAEGSVDTMVRMMRPEATRTPEAIAAQDANVFEGIVNMGTLGALESVYGARLKGAAGVAARAQAARTTPLDTFTSTFMQTALPDGITANTYIPFVWTPLDLVAGFTDAVSKVTRIFAAGGFNEETANLLEQESLEEGRAVIKLLQKATAEYPSGRMGSRFMRGVQEAKSDFAIFGLAAEDPAGAAAAVAEVFARNIPVLAASAGATYLGGPRAGMTVSTLSQFAMEDLRPDQQRFDFLKRKTGINISTPVGMQLFLQDPDAQRIYKAYGRARGAGIAGVQLLTLGYLRGGSFFNHRYLTGQLSERVIFNAISEGAGEALAGLWADKFDLREVVIESAMGFGQGIPNTTIEAYVSGASDLRHARDANNAEKWLSGVTDLKGEIAGIPVAKLDTAASVMGEKLESEGIDTLYIAAGPLDRFDQDGEVATTLGLNPEDVARLAAEGGSVEVTAATFVRHILGKDGFDALIEHTMFDPAGMTPAEASEYSAAGIGDQIRQQLEERARNNLAPGLDEISLTKLTTDITTIQDQVAGQLEASGRYDANKSRLFGLLTAQRYATRAIRMTEETGQPVDAAALFEADNLQIAGGQPAVDTAELFDVTEGDPIQLRQEAFHGTKHTFAPEPGFPNGRPRVDAGGTGAGRQNFGVGFYSAEAEAVGAEYRRQQGDEQGNLYKLDIPDADVANFMDYDAPLSAQPQVVQDAIEKLGFLPEKKTIVGRELYAGDVWFRMRKDLGGQAAADAMIEAGVPGLKYLDAGSRAAAQSSKPFTFEGWLMENFDLEPIDILGSTEEARYDGLYDDYIDKFDSGAASNFVVWDQAVLDRTVLLERNGEILKDAQQSIEQLAAELDAVGGDITQTPRFKDWFKQGAVVDEAGTPMTVYHATGRDLSAFKGISHFGTQRAANDRLVSADVQTEGNNVLPVYLNLQNPLDVGPESEGGGIVWENDNDMFRRVAEVLADRGETDLATRIEEMIDQGPDDADLVRGATPNSHLSIVEMLNEAGYDGLSYVNGNEDAGSTSYVTFEPEQIKSVFNRGAFDPADPNILFQDGVEQVSLTAARLTGERLDRIISDYAYIGVDPKKSKGSLAFINPQQFVEATTDAAYTAEQVAEDAGPLDAERLAAETQTPYIRIDTDGTIVSHEGRHRMAALARAGVTEVPVIVQETAGGYYEAQASRTLRGQFDSETRLDLRDVTPLSEENRQAVLDKFGGGDAAFLFQDSVENKRETKQDERVADKNAHGLMPYLRDYSEAEPRRTKKQALGQTTTNKNARNQLDQVDEILELNPDAHTSAEAWLQMMADAYGTQDVPIAPYRFIEEINGTGAVDNLSRLSEGQIEDANHGFENAAAFREAYTSGKLGVETTAKLFLWSFLSRGVSPYTQEALFIDAFPGIDPWIKQAAAGQLDVEAFSQWAKTAAPKGSGQPGAGSTHNLNAFGRDFLVKMSQSMEGSNQSKLEYIHDLMSDPNSTGQQVRREFAALGEGVGIDNKVVSFTLLVAGYNDILVLDRVQFRQLYNDGRFDGVNIYDGFKKDGKVVTASGFSKQGDGARGILIYEAMERAVAGRIDEIYTELGREGEGSVGRYHWETWVADSQQEASHGSLGAILPAALGDSTAINKVSAKQGEYGSYAYGARYGVDGAGIGYFTYPTPNGNVWLFTIDQFVEFQQEVRKARNGVVPTKFKVTEAGNEPWYTSEEVNVENLDQLAESISSGKAGDAAGTLFQDGADQLISDRLPADPAFEQQRGAAGPRGGFTPSDLITDQEGNPVNLIQIFEKADPTTFLHESGHFWLEQLKADALAVGGGFQQDFKTVTDWWASRPLELREEAVRRAKKKKDKDSVAALQQMTEAQVSAYARSGELRGEGPSRYLSVAMHEQFARGVENYFATGRAPSLSLASAFSHFKLWVMSIYTKLGGAQLDVQFSPQVTAVIDRMLAADEEIALIEGQYNLAAMYSTAEQAGMTPTQFAAYQKKIAEAKDDRRARQLAKHIKELKRERTTWWKEERETLRDETSQEVAAEPAYRLLYALTNQGLADGSTLPEGEALDRMDREVLKEILEAEGFSLNDIPRIDNKAVYEADGLSPGVVAQTFGYDDVDSMILDLVGRQPYAQAVDAAIDAKMEEEHGSIEGSGEAEALASAYSEQTTQVLAAELAALRTTEPAFKQAFVRAYARDRLLEMPSAQVRPYRFLATEKRHANMAGDALKRGDRVAAYQHQFQRLVNHYMATEALKAQRDIEKKTRYLKAFTKPGKKFPTIEADYVDNILRILAAVNFGQGAAGQQSRLNEIVALQTFIEEKQAADGSLLDVPAWITDTSGSVANNTREISYLQFLQLHETIKRYEQQGRTANKIRRGDEELSLAEGKASLLSVLDGMNKSRVQRLRGKTASARGVSYTVASVIALADAQLLKVEALLEAIDGKIMGPWHQTIYEPFNQAAADKYRLQEEVSQVIGELISNLPKDVRRGFGKRVDVGALGTPGMTFNRGELIMMALNVGNESNLDKFIRGMGGDPKTNVKGAGWNINEELIDAALDNLTEEEWSLVRGVWEHAEKLYPTVEGIYRREHGISPDRVEPRTVKTKFGEFKGGYFPMMYDRSIAGVAVDLQQKTALELMQAETGRASINSSMTKARTGYAAPVDLDISRLALGLDNTIHFITHYGAVRNANKILGDRDIRSELETKVGVAYTEQLTKWVAALASNGNDSPPVDIFQLGIQKLYNNTTIGVLGFSYSTLGMQTLGLFNGQDRLLADSGYGPAGIAVLQKDMAEGVAAAFRPSHIEFVIKASGEMQGRRKSMDREVSNVLRNLAGKDGVITGVQRFSMQAIAEVQFYTVDIPVWTAAYNRAQRGIAPGVNKGDTDAAIKYADRVVRMSQSAGGLKDLAAVQRHKGIVKGLTMFYSFFSALYFVLRSAGVEFTQNAKERPIAATGRAATRVFVLLALQSVATGLIKGDLPDWDEEDEEKKSMMEYLAKESVSTALGTIPVVREIAAGWANGYGYSGGAGTIAFDSMTKAMGGMEKFINELGEEETVKSDGDYEDLARRAAPYVLLIGALRGVPAVQANRTLDGLGAMYDEADNWHWSDLLRGYNAERAERREN